MKHVSNYIEYLLSLSTSELNQPMAQDLTEFARGYTFLHTVIIIPYGKLPEQTNSNAFNDYMGPAHAGSSQLTVRSLYIARSYKLPRVTHEVLAVMTHTGRCCSLSTSDQSER